MRSPRVVDPSSYVLPSNFPPPPSARGDSSRDGREVGAERMVAVLLFKVV